MINIIGMLLQMFKKRCKTTVRKKNMCSILYQNSTNSIIYHINIKLLKLIYYINKFFVSWVVLAKHKIMNSK